MEIKKGKALGKGLCQILREQESNHTFVMTEDGLRVIGDKPVTIYPVKIQEEVTHHEFNRINKHNEGCF